MPYVAIPSHLKNVNSLSLELMSPEEMLKMSYGEVLTSETINYRTGAPQMNGLFCQAIFGPVKDWECACGKYKRYRYTGVICDKCGVEVTHSSVRRERMGHITLAAPCVHPWFLRIIPSRISLILDMKSSDVGKITYFSAYVITEINEETKTEYLAKIDKEAKTRIKSTKSEFDKKFEELSRQYQIDKSKKVAPIQDLQAQYDTNKEILKTQQSEMIARIETIAEVAKKELSTLKEKDVITEAQYQELAQKFGRVFKAKIGPEAIVSLLENVDLEKDFKVLKEQILTAKHQTKKKIAKRLKLVKQFLNTKIKPEWMVLKRIMVLPPELRPMLQLDGGRFAASDLNELYRRLVNRNNRLRKLIQIGAPEVILRNEKRMLQEAVEALIDNSTRNGRQVMASTGIKRPLKSLTDVLKGKQGRFRQNLLGKRVDYSGRSVVIIGPDLKLDECGLPKEMALELFKPFMISKIIQKSEAGILSEEEQSFNVHSARRLIETRKPVVFDILDEVIKNKYVLLNRAPTLHRLSFLAFKPILTEGKAIQLHPLVCRGFNADFDGDQMAVHLPITVKGQEEARELMVSTKNLLKPSSGELITAGHQDVVLGAYYLTAAAGDQDQRIRPKSFGDKNEALIAFYNKHIKLAEPIKVKLKLENTKDPEIVETTAGRIIFNNCFPEGYKFFNQDINKKAYESILNQAYKDLGSDAIPKVLDTIKNTTFKYITQSGLSLSVGDLQSPEGKQEILSKSRKKVFKIGHLNEIGMMTENERYKQVVECWREASDEISDLTKEQTDKYGNVGLMVYSGSRGNFSQLNQMVGIRGLSVTAGGETIELPAQHGYKEGLTGLEYFISMKGQRKALADIALKTADAGYLTRRLVDVAQNLIIMSEDCGATEGVEITKEDSLLMSKDIWSRIFGRYLLKDIEIEGQVFAKKGDFVDQALLDKLKAEIGDKLESVWVRSSTKCQLTRGICKKCYGMDFSNHKPVKMGAAVGVIAAQSLGEPSTQLTMRSKHTGGILAKSDITTGLPRVAEIFEARSPKYKVDIIPVDGVVQNIEGSIDSGFKITVTSVPQTLTLSYTPQDKLILEDGQMVKNTDSVIVKDTGEIIKSSVSGEVKIRDNQAIISTNEIETIEFSTLPGMPLLLTKGKKVRKGQAVSEGPLNLQDLLDLAGIGALQSYIVRELNAIYIENGIYVNEKHIELIIKQICSKVQIIDAGDSDLTHGETISRNVAISINKQLVSNNQAPATFKRVVTGISKASLSTESFLSAASFQETSRVLVEAVINRKKDYLTGLKENVILGQLIPSGTGFNQQHMDKIEQIKETVEEFEETA